MQARQYVQQANERARKAYQDLVAELDEVRHPTFAAHKIFSNMATLDMARIGSPWIGHILSLNGLHAGICQHLGICLFQVVRLRGGLEELQQDDPELAAVHQHAHHAQNIHNQALDEQVIILEDAVWNEDAYENNEPAAQPEELPGMGGGINFQQQNAVFPQQPLVGDDMVDAHLRGQHRQTLQGEARWFRENANELPCPGA
jgi:hypothetical protein